MSSNNQIIQLVSPNIESSLKLPKAIKFNAKPEMFQQEKNKIVFMGAHLTDTAAVWFGSLIASNSDFVRNFSDPSHRIKVRGLVRKCRQGPRSAANYSAEFRNLAKNSEGNIDLAIRIDNRFANRKMLSNNLEKTNYHYNRNFGNNSHAFNTTERNHTHMEIDAIAFFTYTKLTEEEKLFNKNSNKFISSFCLIDSGASENFISKKLIKKLNLPTLALDIPISLETIDGKQILGSPIQEYCKNVTLKFNENHIEEINLEINAVFTPMDNFYNSKSESEQLLDKNNSVEEKMADRYIEEAEDNSTDSEEFYNVNKKVYTSSDNHSTTCKKTHIKIQAKFAKTILNCQIRPNRLQKNS
ncbi:hypothetical protein BB561_003241 [Smittium simulii]|uniref:Retrotransposon gag domain-containing protein n=1 Tax=Smittium simulii TaxID=133385 RepID=A0A2T9YMH1_9FUNG|nr:hypothetical protein BB561_003241 [Smittium simulii]